MTLMSDQKMDSINDSTMRQKTIYIQKKKKTYMNRSRPQSIHCPQQQPLVAVSSFVVVVEKQILGSVDFLSSSFRKEEKNF
jgi:hypothetical protein